ncbi:8-oxoguanine DNA glycosylase protein [Halorhabdus tiamatea SARL4B]|uniref:DNA-(apurinic or apyrimidinic site) lyase n=1 Tax=Halorhabdus tiamatea SARL4B TaxID=1033806 RepID=F7PPD6_9EURY|nr:DNA glycosylase [Halorhabdus tiamatea]ERJ04565.1 8-oxoguanine DNA glycosylase protein [Halorhabdus tiamatea SARL4B]CCQ32839.1 8-oxoguanine DNA glycosylase [Halorhabdus tiamatea SARL4B]
MHRGTLSLSSIGPFDLQSTVESGQTFRWTREDGRSYEESDAYGGDAWYATVVVGDGPASDERDLDVVRVRQTDDRLEWEASFDAEATLRRRLRLDDDLPAIRDATPSDPLLETAFDRYWGLRLVRDPPFATLIAFICSAQMRVERIHEMQRALEERFGESITFDGEEYYAFPTPERLAEATEAELRDLGLGYRAPYVQRTAEMVAEGTAHPQEATDLAYEDAREYLAQFVGVGEKVADCVLLFSLGFIEAVPLDTWIRSTIEEYYPECDRGSYAETSRAIRERFGGEYAGYTQTYVFHHLRNGGGSSE